MTSFLVLDDQVVRLNAYRQRLEVAVQLGHRVVLTQSFAKALDEALREKFDVMFLDHDLDHEMAENQGLTGEEFVKRLLKAPARFWPDEVVVHSHNPVGANNMVSRLRKRGIKAVWVAFK